MSSNTSRDWCDPLSSSKQAKMESSSDIFREKAMDNTPLFRQSSVCIAETGQAGIPQLESKENWMLMPILPKSFQTKSEQFWDTCFTRMSEHQNRTYPQSRIMAYALLAAAHRPRPVTWGWGGCGGERERNVSTVTYVQRDITRGAQNIRSFKVHHTGSITAYNTVATGPTILAA